MASIPRFEVATFQFAVVTFYFTGSSFLREDGDRLRIFAATVCVFCYYRRCILLHPFNVIYWWLLAAQSVQRGLTTSGGSSASWGYERAAGSRCPRGCADGGGGVWGRGAGVRGVEVEDESRRVEMPDRTTNPRQIEGLGRDRPKFGPVHRRLASPI